MIDDPRFIGNAARLAHSAIRDEAIGDWSQRFTADELKAQLDVADVPNSKVYTAKDCAEDPQYLARRMVRSVADPIHGEVLQAGIVPHIPQSPGEVRWAGPSIGQHNREVLQELQIGRASCRERVCQYV